MRASKELSLRIVDQIKETDTYKKFSEAKANLKDYPDLKLQIDEFRRESYLLQNSEGDIYDKLEEFERRYAQFRTNPLVENFLQAELAMVRMIQTIYEDICQEIDLELMEDSQEESNE